jgi:hypothetical protein
MTRARCFFAILGAIALLPAGFVAAKIAQTLVVDPVQKALPDTLASVFDQLFDGERRCPSVPRNFPFVRATYPVALAYLDPTDWSGIQGIDHLLVIDSHAEQKPPPGHWKYQGSAVAVFDQGACQGVRFKEVAPGSAYARLGIEQGDLIRRIDGRRVDAPEKALEIYSRLLQRRFVEVDLERRGRLLSYVYRIDDFGVRQVAAHEFVVDGNARYWNRLGESCKASGGIVPYFEDGAQHGISFVSLSPGSIFSRLGIEVGDTIRKVGGIELDSPVKGLALFQELRGTKRIEVELDRRGERIRNVYRLE